MANFIEESLDSIHYSKDELWIECSSDLHSSPVLQSGWVKLVSLPTDGLVWRFLCPKSDFSFTWKTTVLNPASEVQIGATLTDCYINVRNWLNTNYFFLRNWTAAFDATNTRVNFSARFFGDQFNFDPSMFDSANTLFDQTEGTLPAMNLQVGLMIFSKEDGARKKVIAEHVAPIFSEENLVKFRIDEDLHPFTKFDAPAINQSTATAALNHVFEYDLAVYDLSGSPPLPGLAVFENSLFVVRGGSRFENWNLWGNFLTGYMIPENNGILRRSLSREATKLQELYTYWFDSSVGNNYTLKAQIKLTSGTILTSALLNFSGPGKRVWILPTGISNTNIEEICASNGYSVDEVDEVYFNIETQFGGALIANASMLKLVPSNFGEKYFLFENSAGGADVIRLYGASSEGIEVSKEKYRQLDIPDRYWERRKDGSRTIEFKEVYSISSGPISLEDLRNYLDIIVSNNVWQIVNENSIYGYRYPINIQEGSFAIREISGNGQYLYSMSFNYSRAYQERSNGQLNNFF
jgi:hypothetical protein